MLREALCAAVVSSFVANYLLADFSPLLHHILFTLLSFGVAFWGVAIWSIFLYPLYFSPYLALPQAPQIKSWKRIFTSLNQGEEMLEYVDSLSGVGLFRALDLLNRETLIVTSAAAIRDVLQNNSYDYSKNPNTQNYIAMFLGEGLVYAEGVQHKLQRKALNPAFAFRHIKELYPLFWSKSSQMVSLLKTHLVDSAEPAPGEAPAINIADWAGRVSLDIIGAAGFGIDFSSLSEPQSPVFNAYKEALGISGGSRLHFLLATLFPMKLVNILPISAIQQITSNIAYVKAYMKEVLDKRNREAEKAVHIQGGKSEIDVISVAMKYSGFSNKDMLNQATTFLGAGHETSATSVTWGTYVLSQPRYAHIQTRLRDEIRASIPGPFSGTQVDAQMLDKLPYLDAVCKEIMRLYSPAYSVRRYAICDTMILGVRVKKGTYVQAPTWAINKSKDLWGDSGRDFDPERWLTGKSKASGGADNIAYLTFSSGPRSCIGKSFAVAENKAILAALVGSFEIIAVEPNKDIEIDWAIVAKIIGGWEVHLKPVDNWEKNG